MSEDSSTEGLVNGQGGPIGLLEFEKPLSRIQHDIEELRREQRETGRELADEIRKQRERFDGTLKRLYNHLTPWETVLVARHPKRPLVPDYVRMMTRDFCELHGDRLFGDDRAIVTGFARLGGHRVLLVGHNKGRELKERVSCNFGCAHPEGYRKALQKMRLAEKYGLPVICLIDTQGAFPGIGAEERGISQAIAVNMMEMSRLRTPIVCVVIGEGGSGGALGIGVGDRAAMFRHAFYSVISPEGCAAILWKTADQRKHAAEALKLTASELQRLNIVDDVIEEPEGGAHRHPEQAAKNLEEYLVAAVDELSRVTVDTLLRRRYERIRRLGQFFEGDRPAVVVKQRSAAALSPTTKRGGTRTARLAARAQGVGVPLVATPA